MHVQQSSGARGLKFVPSRSIHPYSEYVSNEGSDHPVHLRRLVWALASSRYDNADPYQREAEEKKWKEIAHFSTTFLNVRQ